MINKIINIINTTFAKIAYLSLKHATLRPVKVTAPSANGFRTKASTGKRKKKKTQCLIKKAGSAHIVIFKTTKTIRMSGNVQPTFSFTHDYNAKNRKNLPKTEPARRT